ncbi:MAG: glycosyltransferase family 2 protein [Marinifilaceae bacterium]
MNQQPLVSIIMPSYNSEAFIEESILSIINQTYTNWELLITDDCSKDNTQTIIQRYIQQDSRIHLFTLKENGGAGVARNNSIKQAQGRYIAFCDSDDRWTDNKLDVQISYMQKHKIHLSYTSYYTCTEEGQQFGKVECLNSLNYFKLLRDNAIACLTAVYDTFHYGKIYMPTIRKRQDWALWLQIIKKTKIAHGIQKPLAYYRVRSNSISSNKLNLVKYNVRIYKEVEQFSWTKSIFVFCFLFMPYYTYKKILK